MRFDWYSATFPADPMEVWECLQEGLGASQSAPTRPHHGYEAARHFEAPTGSAATLQWGGRHERLHVFASGYSAHELAAVLRRYYPVHRVTRADVCIDLVEPGSFEKVQPLCRQVADRHRVKVRKIDDDGQGQEGTTYYLGAPTSNVRTRLYEKGKQIVSQSGTFRAPEGFTEQHCLLDWARLEVQVRPEGDAREQLAAAEPEAFWGASRWSQELVQLVLDMRIERIKVGTIWRASDDERAYRHMVTQYGAMLARLAADLGGWDCVGRTIGGDVQDLARLKRRAR